MHGAPSFPQTATARRNARLRAAALATIPLILCVLAAVPRLWAPDLVPYGEHQAAYVADAHARSADTWARAYASPDRPALAAIDPCLRMLPWPVVGWVTARGLLDALGVSLLYLAVRPLVGAIGATAAAVLYAVSPIAWAAARDPAGSFGPLLGAAALLAAVRTIARPTLVRGAMLGIALGLLARSVPLGLLVALLGAVTLFSARASWRVGGVTALALVLAAGPATFAPLAALHSVFVADVVETRSIAFSPTVPLVLLVAASAIVWHARLRVSLPFAIVWMGVAILGGDWVWRTSLRSVVSPVPLEAYVGALARDQLALATSFVLLALVVARHQAVRWGGRIAALVTVALFAAATGLAIRHDAVAERALPPFSIGAGYSAALQGTWVRTTGSLYTSPSLREVTAVTDAIREATGRAGVGEIVLLGTPLDRSLTSHPTAYRLGNLQTRPLGTAMVLPLERETVYLTAAVNPESQEPWLPIEAQRPSSSIGVFTPGGADTGARIIAIRARPLQDWLARAESIPDGRFADGSVLVGVSRERRADGTIDLTLSWQIPPAADGRTLGVRAQVLVDGAVARLRAALPEPGSRRLGHPVGSSAFPPIEVRRGGELVVQTVRLPLPSEGAPPARLSVAVYDERDRQIPTVAGAAELDLPARPQ